MKVVLKASFSESRWVVRREFLKDVAMVVMMAVCWDDQVAALRAFPKEIELADHSVY
jgi:hypothetical protein